jgi:WS/DGAT/MGAT family acyltransferase
MQQLTPMDAAFLYLENESTHAHGTLVWLYDASQCDPSTINRRALLEHMRPRLDVSPIFTRKIHRLPLDFDYPYWVDDPGFELLYHVRELSLSESGSDEGKWSDFCQLVSDVHSRPLDHNHPLWELTLVPDLNGIDGLPAQCFAILGKFHHVAIDGATGMQIIEAIHDTPGQNRTDAPLNARPARLPGLGESLYRAAIRNVGALDKGLNLLGIGPGAKTDGGAADRAPVEETIVEAPDEPDGIPQTLFNKAITPEATWESRSFDLAKIKSMRQAVKGTTVNDVLLTIVAGGLRHYLQYREALPDTPMKAGCPVNIRTEAEAAAGGNMISAIIVNMHTDIADPLRRLRAINRSSNAAKQRASARGSRKILDVVDVVPAQAQALLGNLVGKVSGKMNRAIQFNGSVSNLPGPQQELHMLGGRLQSIGAAMPIMNGFGLFVGLTTCAGSLRISMSSCESILPDPGKLGDCMELSYQELAKATLQRTGLQKAGPRKAGARKAASKKSTPRKAASKKAAPRKAARAKQTRKTH